MKLKVFQLNKTKLLNQGNWDDYIGCNTHKNWSQNIIYLPCAASSKNSNVVSWKVYLRFLKLSFPETWRAISTWYNFKLPSSNIQALEESQLWGLLLLNFPGRFSLGKLFHGCQRAYTWNIKSFPISVIKKYN